MKQMLFSLILMFSLSSMAGYSAKLYEQNSNKQKQIYSFTVEDLTPDGNQVQTTYVDLEGNVVVQEKATLEGAKLLKLEIDHKQLGQKGVIEVKDNKVFFTKEVDGKSTTKDEKLGKTLVVSATFQRFVRDNWETIKKGDELEFRYGVWDRQETVGFEAFKTGEETLGDQKVVVVKMKPSNFVIAALVKPIIFKFAADGAKLLEMNGRVPPKKKDGTQFKDLDAEVTYHY